MKYVKILFAIALVFTLCSAFSIKKGSHKPVYAFGVSASFTDTVVYYTDIQLIDSVHLDKNGFLPHRELYSYQFKNFLELDMNQPNRTCMIYFSDSKKKLDKEALKILGKYKKNKAVALQKIDPEKFRYRVPSSTLRRSAIFIEFPPSSPNDLDLTPG